MRNRLLDDATELARAPSPLQWRNLALAIALGIDTRPARLELPNLRTPGGKPALGANAPDNDQSHHRNQHPNAPAGDSTHAPAGKEKS